tara:strand:+ start:140 stop:532 length:393 start_codon:yes stop_codon:yes gene_type:complete
MAKNPLAGLGKCALFSSFIFAVAIWWVVAESDASAYSTPPAAGADAGGGAAAGVRSRDAAATIPASPRGGERLRGTSPDARRGMRHRNLTRNAGASRKVDTEREKELELKAREIQEAQKDPNSMFDMSNP